MRNLLPLVAGTLIALVALAPAPAQAHPSRYAHSHYGRAPAPPPPRARVTVGPVVRVVVNPWAPSWRPDPRPGWVWTVGHYDRSGRWHPGHWAPAAARAGEVWVPGYWVGSRYVDGYWRPVYRPGRVWVDGAYRGDGSWQQGYWRQTVPDRAEYREDRHEAAEDRAEQREDRADDGRHVEADGYGGTGGSRTGHHDY